MIPDTIADEYAIRLSTGETIQVSEIDSERSPAVAHPKVRKAVDGLLQYCCFVSRDIAEEAKGGYDTRLKPLLRSSPVGCMSKADPHMCRLIHECAMVSIPVCTLHNCMPSPRPLPICWEFSSPLPHPQSKQDGTYRESNDIDVDLIHLREDFEVWEAAIDLGSVIGHAWRRGLYVFIVDN